MNEPRREIAAAGVGRQWPAVHASPQLFDGVLLPHQRTGVEFLLTQPRAILADDVGLGKTVQSAGLMAILMELGKLKPCLVMAPSHLVSQWCDELHRWLPSLRVQDIAAARATGWLIAGGHGPVGCWPVDVLVASYEQVLIHQKALLRTCFGMAVLDEAASLKGGGREHEAALRVTEAADRVLLLTATPIENNLFDTYQLLRLLRIPNLWTPEEFAARFVSFSPEYRDRSGRLVPAKPNGVIEAGLADFHKTFRGHCIRRTAEECGLPLPVRVGELFRFVPLLPEQARQMRGADRILNSLERHRAREAACGVVDGRSSKAEAAIDEILSHPTKPKTVVWAFNRNHLDVMQGLLTEVGIPCVRVDGRITGRRRADLLEQFRLDPSTRVLLGTDVFGSGLNLQHARLMISLGSSYNPAKEAQREGRIRRIGSPFPTYSHVTMLNECGHERTKLKTLLRKAGDADVVLR